MRQRIKILGSKQPIFGGRLSICCLRVLTEIKASLGRALALAERLIRNYWRQLYRCGPIKRSSFSAHSTWWCKFAIHCRPDTVMARYLMAPPRWSETVFQ